MNLEIRARDFWVTETLEHAREVMDPSGLLGICLMGLRAYKTF